MFGVCVMVVTTGTVTHMTKLDDNAVAVFMTERLPVRLSPSRASDYLQCPKMFYYKTLLHLSSPNTVATTTGTLAHHAFEKIFDLPRGERTPELAVPHVREHWEEIVETAAYSTLAKEIGPEAVEAMLKRAEKHVVDYFDIERVNNFDPAGRELHISANVGYIEVHGYIDRLDVVGDADRHIISDYKTGKVPQPRYRDKAFFAMNVYSLVYSLQHDVVPTDLRLVYTVNGSRDDVLRQEVNTATINKTRKKVEAIWTGIKTSAARGEFKPSESVLCGWCQFEPICPAKNPDGAGIAVLDRDGIECPR